MSLPLPPLQRSEIASDSRAPRTEALRAPGPSRLLGAPDGVPLLDELLELELEPGTRDVARRLLEHGASLGHARHVLSLVLHGPARGVFALEAAARVLARSVPVLRAPRAVAGRPCLLFLGTAGAGKTTTLVKIARRLRARGRQVLLASLDPLSSALLERDQDRGEVSLLALREPGDLRRELARRPRTDVVLLDTPGVSIRSPERLVRRLGQLDLPGSGLTPQRLLVLAADTSRSTLTRAVQALAPLEPDGAVLTRVDQTDEPAAAHELLARVRLPVAFLCDGPDARADLIRPSPDLLADWVLRGHLASTAGARPSPLSRPQP